MEGLLLEVKGEVDVNEPVYQDLAHARGDVRVDRGFERAL
jgi:hypothetical protein